MNCVTYWFVTYTRTKRKASPFIFMLKFLRKNSQFFTIDNWKSGKRLLLHVLEHTRYSLFENPERSGHSLFECQDPLGDPDRVIWVPWAIRHSNKDYPERSGTSNKEYLVCSGTSNNNVFANFQLLIVKFLFFSPQKFSIKMKGLSFLFFLIYGGLLNKRCFINTVHPRHNIEHALWIL